MNNDLKINLNRDLIIWVVVSLVVAIIFSANSNGLSEYLFFTLSYIFIFYILTSAWEIWEFRPADLVIISSATLIGWFIGSFFIKRKVRFFN